MAGDDFFAASPAGPATPAAAGTVSAVVPQGPVPAQPGPSPVPWTPGAGGHAAAYPKPAAGPGWKLIAVVLSLAGILAIGAWMVWLEWPSSGNRVPISDAQLFGRQARHVLPAPVTRDECSQAVQAFKGIAADPAARAAFIDSCLTG